MNNHYIETRRTEKKNNQDTEFLDKTPFVNQVEKSYRVNVLSTPEAISKKAHLFLDEKVAVVGVDVIRCATTSCSVLAAGAKAVRFYGKRTELIEKLFTDLEHYKKMKIRCVTMGEFAGKKIPGGIAANSPKMITPKLVKGKHVLFLTKNLGDLCCDIIEVIEANRSRWSGDFVIGCLLNLDAVCRFIGKLREIRMVVCCGGFRKTESVEDLFFTGKMITTMKIPEKECDDGALTSIAVYEKYKTIEKLRETIRYCRVSQVLENFGMIDDVESSLTGKHINPRIMRSLTSIVPTLVWKNGDPWFSSQQ